jgi:HlyD family secretion protein
MKWLTRNLPLLLAACAVAAATAYALWPRPIPVDLATVTRGPLQVTVDEDGKTRVHERYIVSAPLAGQLARIDLEAGDAVAAGQTLLATIEPVDPSLIDDRTRSEAEARVRAAEASGERASARIEEAREARELANHEFERAKSLRKSQSIPQAEYDRTEHEERRTAQALRAAEFALQVAQFELEMAKAVLIRTRPRGANDQGPERLELRSPVSGRVLRVYQESARVVEPGLALIELGDPAEMEVEIDVLSSDAAAIRPGAKVWLEHWGGEQPLQARVRLVEPSGFTKISALGVEEQRVNVIADFVGPPESRVQLGDAYRVEARIVTWESPDVLKVRAGCLFRHGGKWAVYLAEGAFANLRSVEIGKNNGLEAEVLTGLQAGDRVLLHPSDKITDGTRVAPRAID